MVASETYLSWYQPYVVEKVDISYKVQCRFVFVSTITVALTERAEVNWCIPASGRLAAKRNMAHSSLLLLEMNAVVTLMAN